MYNNYITAGGGFMTTSLRAKEQKNIGIDYHFHIRREYFQLGVMMSGEEFLSNNNVQAHFGYGLRKETVKSNLALFAGFTYFTGVIGRTDSVGNPYPEYYTSQGFYVSGQLVTKLSYDIGIGVQVFGEISKIQSLAGFRLIMFFSGAYRGPKKNYNPHVRSERGK